jgi:hypothetical protein
MHSQVLLFLALLFGLLIGMLNAVVGYTNARQRSQGATIWWALGIAFGFAAAITGELALLPGDATGLDSMWRMFSFAAIIVALGTLFVPFVLAGGRKNAANHLRLADQTSMHVRAHFDRLADSATGYITDTSLTKILRDNATEIELRRTASYVRENLWSIGHKVGEERYFSFAVDSAVSSEEQTDDVYAISREDLEDWGRKVGERYRSWLPKAHWGQLT